MMKDDGCCRKTSATIDDVNDDVKKGSVIKTNNDNVNDNGKWLMQCGHNANALIELSWS